MSSASRLVTCVRDRVRPFSGVQPSGTASTARVSSRRRRPLRLRSGSCDTEVYADSRVIRSASPGTRARLTYTFPARACPPAGRERPFIVCTAHEGCVHARSWAPPSVSCSSRRLSPHRGGGGAPCRKRLRKPAVMDGTCETRSRKPLLVFRAEMAEQSPTACDDPPALPLRA